MRVASDTLFNISGTLSTTTSAPIDIDQEWVVAIQFVWTGSPTGMVGITGSNDAVNFSPIVGYADQATSGSAGNYLYNVPNVGFRWIQAHYIQSSGSGSVICNFNAKGN